MITKQELETIRSKAPLLSEGAISPFQVSGMSKRIKAQYKKNIQVRYNAEFEYSRQNITKEQLKKEQEEKEQNDLKTEILQITSQMNTIKDFPQIKSKRENNLKKVYRGYELKLKELQGGIKNE